MADFTLRPLTIPERKYTYAQSSQLQGQTGNIGHLWGLWLRWDRILYLLV